ncbi:AfsR/SARP family transcriptional regulator [Streptomyces flavofungini]|uniref:AfsR/SARP family transcriptional regulator n=1 Tax=Streptomyces flavofungini TaxID=68200 RepID=UPI0025AF722E|nr:BTAD domain-containing putative transcriptional regulator [Streptomyces flavofungini]WJV49151.1 BTAD domain-containing putative transcriptional regulator [Streptomyces flavofungini]
MRYRVLGVTRALRPDGTTVPVGGARLRALLAALALRPGRGIPAAVLVDQVWGGAPPADAPAALQALVGRLRRALGASAVASADGGYQLCAAPDDVDAHRFERLVGEGTRALADGDPAKAAALLDDALGLWHGDAFTDLPDHTAEATRWSARRLDALRARLTAALALGQAESALPELAALCDSHPLDEPLQALRLRALRDVGRPAEALAAYEDVRRTLADRLGADPGPELRALHGELLRPGAGAFGDGVGAAGSGGESPGVGAGSAVGVRGGAETGFDRGGPSGLVGPGARPTRPAPGNLRARLTSFVGRTGDIDAIRDDLGRARLVTLTGPGGAGKTRLSQEAAEAVADASPDGVWLAELAPVDDPDDVPEAVLTALGARESVLRGAGAEELRAAAERHADDPVVRLTEHCAPLRMLLVLDNCEHVIDAAARLTDRLLAECPGLTVLATSREPLGVPGELVRPVEPLPEPFALRLLADRGAAARPGFRIDDDARAAAEICHRLDGLPLAIELAAARLRMLTPRQIADRLDDRFRLLTSGSRTVLPRQQTLRAVVDWSWDLLDPAERAVLRRLSVFAGGCDLAAAEAVCVGEEAGGGGVRGDFGGSGGEGAGGARCRVERRDVAGILGSLVDKSLVVAAPAAHDDVMRYRLLETVSEYAAERLDEAGERAGVTRAHLVHFREFARVTDPALRRRGQREAIAAFEAEYENLRTALRHAVAARDEQEALCLVLSLSWFWLIRDLRQEVRNWSREVIALGPDPFAGPVTPAAPLYGRCTDVPPPLTGELLQEARRGVHLIQLSCMDMDPVGWHTPDADRKLRAIRDTYRPGLPQTCRSPGNLWFFAVLMTGDVDRLHDAVDATVAACRDLGLDWELAAALQQRANILANRADWAGDAVTDADEALEICTRIGDSFGAAEALSSRGEAHERRGEYLLAADDFQAAMDHAGEVGARAQVSLLTARLGTALIEAGQEERGEVLLRQVIDDSGSRLNGALPAARLFLVGLLGRTGRVREAREQLVTLREEFAVFGFALFEGFLLGSHAWLDTLDGRYERGLGHALEAVERAAEPLAQIVAPQLLSVHLATAARALASHDPGRAADAARLLAVADARLPSGHVPVAMEREVRAAAERTVRAVLGDAGYTAAYAEGDGLSWEEAVASAGL